MLFGKKKEPVLPKPQNLKEFLIKNWKIILAIVYVLSPLDFVPDGIPLFGLSDDLIVLILMLLWQYISYRRDLAKVKKGDVVEGEIVS